MRGEERDVELVAAAREGDNDAFATLVERHRPMLLVLCRGMLGDPGLAEDAAQEATLQALLSLDRLRDPYRFGPWLAGIGLNVCRQWRRYRARDAWSLDALLGGRRWDEPIASSIDPADHQVAAELAERVRQAVASLPAGQRAVAALFYLDGLTHAETAAALGVAVSAVKTRLHNARTTLRRTLGVAWEEEAEMETGVDTGFVEVRVEDVLRTPVAEPPGQRYVVLLAAPDGERLLPIWVGQFEGDAIAVLLVEAQPLRPLTFVFAARLLEAAGARVREVRVNRLVEETFYAEVVVEGPAGTHMFDARPSDAISLALATSVPIRVAEAVLQQAGRTRAEIHERRPADSWSAREKADEIRERFSHPMPRGPAF